jgi:hypothetical protein
MSFCPYPTHKGCGGSLENMESISEVFLSVGPWEGGVGPDGRTLSGLSLPKVLRFEVSELICFRLVCFGNYNFFPLPVFYHVCRPLGFRTFRLY